MSISIVAIQEFKINNVSEETKDVAREIKSLINDFNNLNGIRSIYVNTLELTLDDKKYSIMDSYVRGAEDEDVLWGDDCELITALEDVESSREIEFKVAYELTYSYWIGLDYGIAREMFGNRNDELKDNIQYKCIEYSCEADSISFESFGLENEARWTPLDYEDVNDIEEWSAETINVVINVGDGKAFDFETRESLIGWVESFRNRYDGLNTPGIDEGELFYGESVHIDGAELKGFINDLNTLAKIGELIGATIVIEANILAFEPAECVAVRIEYVDGELTAKYCRM